MTATKAGPFAVVRNPDDGGVVGDMLGGPVEIANAGHVDSVALKVVLAGEVPQAARAAALGRAAEELAAERDEYADVAPAAGYAFAGERCVVPQDILVDESWHAEFDDMLAARVGTLVLDDRLGACSEVGPSSTYPRMSGLRARSPRPSTAMRIPSPVVPWSSA